MPSLRPTPLALALGLLAGATHAQAPGATTPAPATPTQASVLDAIDADSREAARPSPMPPAPAPTVTTVTTTTEVAPAAPPADPQATTVAPDTLAAAPATPAPTPLPVTTTAVTTTTTTVDTTPVPIVLSVPAMALPATSGPAVAAPVPGPAPAAGVLVPPGPPSFEPGAGTPGNPPLYVGVTYSHMFPVGGGALRSGPGFGVFLGIPLTPWIALEGGVSGFQLPAKSGNDNADLRPIFGQLGLAYSLFTYGPLDFLLLGSGGYGRAGNGVRNTNDRALTYADGGFGVTGRTGFTNLSVRADVRYARLFQVAEQNTVRANAGVLLALGAPPPVVDAGPRDTDNDGVVDGRDRCPATPAGTLVDGFGCPVPPVVDSDGDGIPDATDLCPGTAPNAITDKRGCEASRPAPVVVVESPAPVVVAAPLLITPAPASPGPMAAPGETRVETVVTRPATADDPDGDGVSGPADRCPDTLPGLLVDGRGCAIRQTLVLPTVAFAGRATRLGGEADATLAALARLLAGQPDLRVEVAGYTDALGPHAANLALSTRRAQAVRAALLGRGAPAGRVTAEGFGEALPLADNATEAGRAQNRRIEFTFVPAGS